MPKSNFAVLAATLLSSVAFTGTSLAQDATGAPQFSLTGTGGVVGLMLPSFDTGILGTSVGGTVFGGMVAGNLTGSVGPIGDYEGLISLSAFGVYGMGMSGSGTTTLSGPGVVTVYGLTTPDSGSIDLDGAAASFNVTGANGANATFAGAGTVINRGDVTPDAPGFINGWMTEGESGERAAYGAIADDSGGLFIASGDFEGLEITTSTSRQVFYGGADLTFGLAGQGDGGVSFVGYVGPSVKTLHDVATTVTSINITEEEDDGDDVLLPEWAMSRQDMLSSLYLGGVVGGSVAIVGSPGVVYSIGVEGGLYGVGARWQGQDTYLTCCGVNGIDIPSPDLSVTADPVTMTLANAIAYSAKANASVTHAIDANKALTFGGFAEYLSHVAQVNHSGYLQTGGSEDWTSGTPSGGTTVLSWGDMLAFGVTASLTGTF